MANRIKRGVSLYSFQEPYFLGELNLQGAIRTATELGANGIESIAEQMMPGFPDLTDEFYAQWHEWLKQYGAVSVAHDMFLDTKRFKDRLLTDEEMIESVRRDIRHAAKLGASIIRVLVITPPHIIEATADYAREHGVKLCVEVHSPWSFDHPWILEHIAVADRKGLDAVGVIPDLGIFVRRFPRVIWERHIRDGATPSIVEKIVERYDSKGDLEALQQDVVEWGGNDVDRKLAQTATHFIDSDVEKLVEYAPYIHHVHAKFYEMTDEGEEYSIPYPEIIDAFKRSGYDGYLASEYEGNRHIQDAFEVDAVEQVRRHQNMIQALLDDKE